MSEHAVVSEQCTPVMLLKQKPNGGFPAGIRTRLLLRWTACRHSTQHGCWSARRQHRPFRLTRDHLHTWSPLLHLQSWQKLSPAFASLQSTWSTQTGATARPQPALTPCLKFHHKPTIQCTFPKRAAAAPARHTVCLHCTPQVLPACILNVHPPRMSRASSRICET